MPTVYEHSSSGSSDNSSQDSYPNDYEDDKSQSGSSLIEYDDSDDDDDDLESDLDTDDFDIMDYDEEAKEELRQISAFFENIESLLPDIEEISEDITEEVIKKENEVEQLEDEGEFVDPLTGAMLHQASISEPQEEDIKEEQPEYDDDEDVEEEESEESELVSDSELTFPDEVEEVVVIVQPEEEEAAFGAFLDMETVKEVTLEEQVDVDEIALEREQERERQNVVDFLEKIITNAVYRAEFVSTDVQLRQKVDKNLVMEALKSKSIELFDAKEQRNFLEKKCVEYYKRKKSYRAITVDNPKTFEEDRTKFYQNLARLDEWLQKEIGASDKHEDVMKKLEQELQQLKEESTTEITEFEALLKKTLQLDHRPSLSKIVENLFRYMGQLRKEINEVRFKLITVQHIKVDLLQELSKFDNFGHVNIKDLENMCIALNHDLKKLRVRCRSNIHTMAHYMEKQKMLSDAVHNQKLALEELHDERLSLRKHIFRLKIQRTEIRSGIKTINFLNSLIDKPTLMVDYDQTMEATLVNAEVLHNLRNHKRQLEEDISKLIQHCFAKSFDE